MARKAAWTVGCKRTKHPGIFQTKKDEFRVRVRAVDPRTGKTREANRLVQGTIREAVAAQDSMREEIRAGSMPAERRRIGEFAQSWVRLKVTEVDPNTAERYAEALDGHVLEVFGDFFVDALTKADVQTWVTEQIGKGYSVATVNGWFRVLRTLMRDAVDAFELHQDPTAHIVFPTSGEDDPDEDEDEVEDSARTLNAEELTRFLAALKKKRPGQYALVATLAMTGLRFCHASALRWTDIDEAGGIIRIRRKNARARVGKVTRKKNAPRRYPLHPELAEILRAHRAYLLKRQHRGLANGWCFPSKTGGLQRPSSLIKCFATALTLANIKKHITPHSLRRSFVDLNRLAGVTGLVTKSLTGHATDRMLEHYSTPALAEQRQAVGNVVDLLKAKSGYPSGDPTNLKKKATR